MIFTFWSGSAAPDDAPREWREVDKDFTVFGDRDAAEALAEAAGPGAAGLFDDIRLPACRSDIGRLALMWRHGGMYVDMHTGPADVRALARAFALLASYEVVLFDWTDRHKPGAPDVHIINTTLLARRRSDIVRSMLLVAIAGLEAQRRREHATGIRGGYSVAEISGLGAMLTTAFRFEDGRFQLLDALKDRVAIAPLVPSFPELPVHLYKHYGYRTPGSHWSERERDEFLFFSSAHCWASADAG